jgi:hypothetical protein
VIFTDVLNAVRGGWDRVADRGSLRLVMSGAVLFAFIPVVNLVMSLRSSNLLVGFTEWGTALEWVAAYGAFSLWLLAFVAHAGPIVAGGAIGDRSAAIHYRATLLGLLLAVGAMLSAGVQAGLTWISNANAGIASAGTAFRGSVERLEGWYWIRFVGIAIFALAQVWFVIALWRARGEAPVVEAHEDIGDDTYEAVGLGRLRLGTVGLFSVAVVFGFLFPSLESSHITNTLAADQSRYFDAEANPALAEISLGHDLYLSEGCWYCHSQEVRQIVTDVGLGAVSLPGDYAWEVPAPRGTNRIGPDLFHVGSREATSSPQDVLDYLFDPRRVRPWSTMPSYQHLSDEELQALALYLVNLK